MVACRMGSANFANLSMKLVAMATSLSDHKMNERLMKHSHTSTNPENLVKIGTVDSEITDDNLDHYEV